jgi:hypothetical protein
MTSGLGLVRYEHPRVHEIRKGRRRITENAANNGKYNVAGGCCDRLVGWALRGPERGKRI